MASGESLGPCLALLFGLPVMIGMYSDITFKQEDL